MSQIQDLNKQMTDLHEIHNAEMIKMQAQIPAPSGEKFPCPYDGEIHDHNGIIEHIVK